MNLQTQEQDDTQPKQRELFENLTQDIPVQILLKIHELENSYGQRKPPNIEEIRNKIETPYSYVSENVTGLTPVLIQKQRDGSSQRITLTDKGIETVTLIRQLQETLQGPTISNGKYPLDFQQIAADLSDNKTHQAKLKQRLRQAYLTGHTDGIQETLDALDTETLRGDQ